MSFSLPELPYAHDALEPYMSRETLEYHHDKHHLAYVNNGNNLAKGTEWENKPVEEVVKGTYGKNQGLFNNAGQHYNHIHFWKWMKPGGGGEKDPRRARKKDHRRSWLRRQHEGRIHSGRRHAIRLRLVLACGRGWQDRRDEDAQRREPTRAGRHAHSRLRCLGALLLYRLPQPTARLPQGVRRSPGQLGIRGRNVPGGHEITINASPGMQNCANGVLPLARTEGQ